MWCYKYNLYCMDSCGNFPKNKFDTEYRVIIRIRTNSNTFFMKLQFFSDASCGVGCWMWGRYNCKTVLIFKLSSRTSFFQPSDNTVQPVCENPSVTLCPFPPSHFFSFVFLWQQLTDELNIRLVGFFCEPQTLKSGFPVALPNST